MDRQTDQRIADMTGMEGLPRSNGTLVFHDEWERRVFAMAVTLCQQGRYDWDEFRQHLIAAIADSGETPENPKPNAPGYFEHWLASFEKVLEGKGLIPAEGSVAPSAD